MGQVIFSKKFNIFLVAFLILGIILALTPEPRDKRLPDSEFLNNSLVETVSATLLSNWIIEGRKDFTVIDLRSEQNEITIPNAIVTSELKELLDLPKEQKVILISDSDEDAVKLARILNFNKFKAFVVSGGIASWKKDVLNPVAPTDNDEAKWADYNKRQAVANFLTGKSVDHSVAPVAPTGGAPVRKRKSGGGGGGC